MLNGRKWPLAWQRDFDGDMMSTHLPLKLGTTFYDAKLLSLRDRPDGPHNPLRGAMSLEKPSFDDNTLKISLRDTAAGAGHRGVFADRRKEARMSQPFDTEHRPHAP